VLDTFGVWFYTWFLCVLSKDLNDY
jgi:hypothetical protein